MPVAVLQQAVAVLAEDALVAQLNASLNTSEPVVATTDVSVTVAVKLDMTSTVAHTVQVPNSSVTATVPATVLSQVAEQVGKDVALVVTSFDNDNVTESSISSEHTQVAPAVSVRLVELGTGRNVAIGVDFVEYIHITLGAATHSAAQCAFWDAANLQWSTAGLQQYLSDTGEVVCMTPHLTLFSAVISSFETVLKCSNARVLTAEGLANLSKGGWWYRPSALTLWAMVLTFVVLLIMSMLYDADQRRRFPWQDDNLL